MRFQMALTLPIDDPGTSSFLNEAKLRELQTAVTDCSNAVRGQTKKRDILKQVQRFLQFKRVFSSRGIHGITGILTLKSLAQDIVFKISLDLDRSVEHENIITQELNRLRPYCPHFVGNVGMIGIPVSNDFINEPDQESLFKNNNDYFPCNVLLMEYVSPISLYHVCKMLAPRKSIVVSILAQIMLALDIAQTKCQFTSYDPHLDNVLIRQVEEDALFLYRHKGKAWLIPTFGFYPVIIDLGSSYVKAVEGHPQYTQIDNYQAGLQPTIYDQLNDVHHLLVSVLGYLSTKGYAYDHLHTKFLHLFRHVPVMATRGWKKLPYDLLELVLRKIKSDYPEARDHPVFSEYGDDLIHLLNGLIILPWMEEGERGFGDCLGDLLGELQKIHDMKSVNSSDDILYIVRETIDCINAHRDHYENDPVEAIKRFAADWRQRIGFIVHHNSKAIPRDLDFELLFTSALKVADRLSSNYYRYVQKHAELISSAYMKTSITGPVSAAKILLQDATPRFEVRREAKIYIWDADRETHSVVTSHALSDEQLEAVNNAGIFRKGDLLLGFLGMEPSLRSPLLPPI